MIWYPHPRRAVSLIEMLVCLAIISIVSVIGMTYHQGALDQGDLKFVMPKVVDRLRLAQQLSRDIGAKIVIEVPRGESVIKITVTKGDPVDPVEWDISQWGNVKGVPETITDFIRHLVEANGGSLNLVGKWDLAREGLIKRKLVWREYSYDGGGEEPRSFTFFPSANPQGGSVKFGTRYADARLFLARDRMEWQFD